VSYITYVVHILLPVLLTHDRC